MLGTYHKIYKYPIQNTRLLGGVTYFLINLSISHLLANVRQLNNPLSNETTTYSSRFLSDTPELLYHHILASRI